MVKYVEGQFEEDYIETLGVNFMEKSITLKSTEVTFSIWDLGGQRRCHYATACMQRCGSNFVHV